VPADGRGDWEADLVLVFERLDFSLWVVKRGGGGETVYGVLRQGTLRARTPIRPLEKENVTLSQVASPKLKGNFSQNQRSKTLDEGSDVFAREPTTVIGEGTTDLLLKKMQPTPTKTVLTTRPNRRV